MKNKFLFIITTILFITIILNTNNKKKIDHFYPKKNKRIKRNIKKTNWNSFLNKIKENFLNTDNKKIVKNKVKKKNRMISSMSNDENISPEIEFEIKKYRSPLLENNVNIKFIENFSSFKKKKIVNIDLIKCQYDNTSNKSIKIISNKNDILDKLDIRIYRVLEKFNNDTTDIIVQKCNNRDKNKYLYSYLNKNMLKLNDDYLNIFYNKIVLHNKNKLKIDKILNIPEGCLIKIYKNNKLIKNLFLTKSKKKINLKLFNINNINKIEILGLKTEFNIVNNNLKFTNIPIIIFKNSKINNIVDIIEGKENFKFKFYSGDEFIEKNNLFYIPFDSMYTIDNNYSFYIDDNNKKYMIKDISSISINENMIITLVNNNNFVGHYSNID